MGIIFSFISAKGHKLQKHLETFFLMLPVVASYNCQLLLKVSSIGASVKLDLVHLEIQVMEKINENLSRITSQRTSLYMLCSN